MLDKSTIKAIHIKVSANRTYAHGFSKHKYLLSRMIFCTKCGRVLYGQTTFKGHIKHRYYRHRNRDDCKSRLSYIHANRIEEAVLLHLIKMYGDKEYLKRAMERAIPNKKKIARLRKEHQALSDQSKKMENERQNLVKSIAKGIISDDDARKAIVDIRDRADLIKPRIEQIDSELENTPTKKQTAQRAKVLYAAHREMAKSPKHLFKVSYDENRQMVENAIGGKDHQGNRLGVYVKKNGSNNEVSFTIKGVLPDLQIEGKLPLHKLEYGDLLNLDPYYQDIDNEVDKFKLNMAGI